MQKPSSFSRSTLVDGFFVVLPIFLAILIITEILDFVKVIAGPIGQLSPIKRIAGVDVSLIVSLLMLSIIFFLAGLLARTQLGARVGAWFENRIFMRIPGYNLLKSFTDRFAGIDSDGRFSPALLTTEVDTKLLVLVVEELDTDSCMVFVPMAPTPAVGTLQIVPCRRVQKINVSMSKFMDCFWQFGMDAKSLVNKQVPANAPLKT